MKTGRTLPEPWPVHTAEIRPWRTNPDARDSSGRRPSREDRLLTQIEVQVPPPIRNSTPGLSSSSAAAAEAAAAAVARLDEIGSARLGALGGFLLRTESVATSKIERISADLDDFARALVGQRAGAAAREMAAAVTAIGGLIDDADEHEVSLAAIDRAQGLLLADDPFEGDAAGAPRTMQNWLGGSDFSPRDAIYVPPPPGLVPRLLEDLVTFANRTDLSPIAQAAIVHAQFESIHPYTDGNGRIGRALINVVLRRRGLTSRIVVPVASALLADVDAYFDALTAYRSGDVDHLVRALADATLLAASEATTSALALEALPSEWRTRMTVRRASTTDRLLEHLLSAPVLTDKVAAALTGASTRRSRDALDAIAATEIVTEITGHARNRVWIVGDVLDEIDRLEARIGVRARPSLSS
jgi:Fic family protein